MFGSFTQKGSGRRRMPDALVLQVNDNIVTRRGTHENQGPRPKSTVSFQVTTDNGGAVHECKPNGASNHPLRPVGHEFGAIAPREPLAEGS